MQTKHLTSGIIVRTDHSLSFPSASQHVFCPFSNIYKGKLKNPTEFGYKLEITENEDLILTDFKVHIGNPSDEKLLLDAVKHHIEKT